MQCTPVKMLVEIVSQQFKLPQEFQDWTLRRVEKLGYPESKLLNLKGPILRLSKIFQEKIESDYWKDPSLLAAYLIYFAPLNLVRMSAVMFEAQNFGFFENSRKIVDMGAGTGVVLWALRQLSKIHDSKVLLVEKSASAISVLKELSMAGLRGYDLLAEISERGMADVDTVVMSYSLNEMEVLPPILKKVENLIVLEPSTNESARKLQGYRQLLLNDGWNIWAPCTHREHCPLLVNSKTDWCHDRIHWEMPEWFKTLDRNLPIKNNTLTYSYLIASRNRPSPIGAGLSRVIGDLQEERGKKKAMICRSKKREFLSWLDRNNLVLQIDRGQLIEIKNSELKSNEVRIDSASSVEFIKFP